MKTAKCEYQIPVNNNENIGQIIKNHLGVCVGGVVLGFKLYEQFPRFFQPSKPKLQSWRVLKNTFTASSD